MILKENVQIKVSEFVSNWGAIYASDGERLKAKMLEILAEHNDSVEIDISFEGVNNVLTTFLNPVFGDIIRDKSPEILKQISISNYNAIIKEQVINTVKLYKEKYNFYSNPKNHNIVDKYY